MNADRATRGSAWTVSRRGFMKGLAAAGTLSVIAGRRASAGGRVVVGTWGGDYERLLQKDIAVPLLQPQGIEVLYDTANDSPRKTKMRCGKPTP